MKRLVYTRLIESLDRLLDLYFLIQAGDLPPSLLRIFFVRLLHLPRLGLLLRNLSSLRCLKTYDSGRRGCLLKGYLPAYSVFLANFAKTIWKVETSFYGNIFLWKCQVMPAEFSEFRKLSWIPTMLAKFRQIFDGITSDVNEILIKSGR